MYKMCKTEQSAARQRALELGLLTAMGSHPFEEISISDLCAQIGIPRKSFYRYFSSKEGALHALLDHTLLEMETVHLDPRSSHSVLVKDLELFFQYWKMQKPLLDALNRSGLGSMLIERAVELALTINFGTPNLLLAQDTAQRMKAHATAFMVCGLMSTVLQWHHEGYKEPPAQMARLALRLLTEPLLTNTELTP